MVGLDMGGLDAFIERCIIAACQIVGAAVLVTIGVLVALTLWRRILVLYAETRKGLYDPARAHDGGAQELRSRDEVPANADRGPTQRDPRPGLPVGSDVPGMSGATAGD